MFMGNGTIQDRGETGLGVMDHDEGLGKAQAHTSYLDDMGLNPFLLYALAKGLEGIQ
jgi:hypothetical protein